MYAFQQYVHIAFVRERKKKSKRPTFVLKEQRKRKTKRQEVFRDEIKAAFVFILQKVVNYEKKNPL